MPLRSVCLVCCVVLPAGILLAGCATGGAVKNVQADVSLARDQLRGLAVHVASLDSLLRAQAAESRRLWADLDTGGDEIKQRVRQTQAKLDEVARRMADLSKVVESVRLSSGSRAAPGYGRNPAASGDSSASSGARSTVLADPRGLYDQASDDMKAGDFGLAASEFLQFLESFAQSDLADNARYWLGQCYVQQRDFPRAVEAFERVLANHATSEVLPAAMLALGDALLRTREREKGIQQLRALLKAYPSSEEAAQARDRLKTLSTPPRGTSPGKRR